MPGGWTDSTRSSRLPGDWKSKRAYVLAKAKHRCQAGDGCRARATEVDHIKPGDNHALSNLRAICTKCHRSKTSKEGNDARWHSH